MAILSADDFVSVRGALDTSIEADDLPDALIALPIYAGRAEMLLLQRDPLAATRVGTDALHIRLAAIFFTASLIAPAIPAITRFQAGSITDRTMYDRTIDWNARASDLKAQADAEIDAVLDAGFEDDADRFIAFTTAGGGRSWRAGAYPVGVIR